MTMFDFNKYDSFFFDCDGVLLDSNKIKTDAFYEIGKEYSIEVADQLVDYHTQHCGVSRFKKIEYMHKVILNKEQDLEAKVKVDTDKFSCLVKNKLFECNETKEVRAFLNKIPQDTETFVVSGGFETELRNILKHKNLDQYFEDIYGSPRTKEAILEGIFEQKNRGKGIFFGDAELDYKVAKAFGMDFVFISQYTNFKEWKSFFKDKNVVIVNNFSELL